MEAPTPLEGLVPFTEAWSFHVSLREGLGPETAHVRGFPILGRNSVGQSAVGCCAGAMQEPGTWAMSRRFIPEDSSTIATPPPMFHPTKSTRKRATSIETCLGKVGVLDAKVTGVGRCF